MQGQIPFGGFIGKSICSCYKYTKKSRKVCSARIRALLLTGKFMINNTHGTLFIYYINRLQWGLDHVVQPICNLKGPDKWYAYRPKPSLFSAGFSSCSYWIHFLLLLKINLKAEFYWSHNTLSFGLVGWLFPVEKSINITIAAHWVCLLM